MPNSLFRMGALVAVFGSLALAAGCCSKKAPPDAELPIVKQLEQEQQRFLGDIAKNVNIPGAVHTDPWLDAPVIVVGAVDLNVDGVPCGTMANASAALRELQDVLKNKRSLWQQLNPGKPFAGIALLAASRDLPGKTVVDLVRASAEAGFPLVYVVVHAVTKGPVAPDHLGIVGLGAHAEVDGGAVRDKPILSVTGEGAGMIAWDGASDSAAPSPVDLTSTRGKDGDERVPGLAAACAARRKDRGVGTETVVLQGAENVSLQALVGMADTLKELDVQLRLALP